MNKILMWVSFLLSTILIIVNFAAGNWSVHLIIKWSNSPWILAILWICIWLVAWFALKGFLNEKWSDNYDDNSWVNF